MVDTLLELADTLSILDQISFIISVSRVRDIRGTMTTSRHRGCLELNIWEMLSSIGVIPGHVWVTMVGFLDALL